MSNNVRLGKTVILVLHAKHGDSIIVTTIDSNGKPFNILIDGGTAKTYDDCLKSKIKDLKNINLLVLTHIDSDHIGGLIKYLKNPFFDSDQVDKYWFNSKNIKFLRDGDNISYNQAKTLEQLLTNKGQLSTKWAQDIQWPMKLQLAPGIDVEILSPTSEILEELYKKWPDLSDDYYKKLEDVNISSTVQSQLSRGSLEQLAAQDDSPEKSINEDLFNSSSIAFVLRTFDKSILLLGDSHPDLVKRTMTANGYSIKNKLEVDIVKISHHGSKNNTTKDILDMIDCDKYVISTNGGSSTHTHPDRETIARIIYHPERVRQKFAKFREIYLNYPIGVVERKAGEFISVQDQLSGNWKLIDGINEF